LPPGVFCYTASQSGEYRLKRKEGERDKEEAKKMKTTTRI